MLPEIINNMVAGMNAYRVVIWCSALLLAAACSPAGTYDALKEKAPEAGDFASSLAAEYLAYAESQSDLGNTADADYFAAKGLKALKEGFVDPEKVGLFTGDQKPKLEEARDTLMALLAENVRRVLPQQAARAQMLYDCWYHQVSQLKIGDEAPCEAEFKASLGELEEVAESFTYQDKQSYTLQFSGGSTKLTSAIRKDLAAAAELTMSLQKYQVELRAMPSGDGQAASKIAKKRAALARDALVAKGVKAAWIEIHDDTTAKTVYLSNDDEEQPKNTVELRVKAKMAAGGSE